MESIEELFPERSQAHHCGRAGQVLPNEASPQLARLLPPLGEVARMIVHNDLCAVSRGGCAEQCVSDRGGFVRRNRQMHDVRTELPHDSSELGVVSERPTRVR